jgi:hypothetical protein
MLNPRGLKLIGGRHVEALQARGVHSLRVGRPGNRLCTPEGSNAEDPGKDECCSERDYMNEGGEPRDHPCRLSKLRPFGWGFSFAC